MEKTKFYSYKNGELPRGCQLCVQGKKLVLFIESIEEFVGLNGETFGPFEKDEIVNLPKQIADILVEDKKAEVVVD